MGHQPIESVYQSALIVHLASTALVQQKETLDEVHLMDLVLLDLFVMVMQLKQLTHKVLKAIIINKSQKAPQQHAMVLSDMARNHPTPGLLP
jgi:hypothetical protein